MAAATIDRLKVVVAAAETREVVSPMMARSKTRQQPVASRSLLHSMTWSSGCRLGQHLLFGIEVVVHHVDAGLFLEQLQRPSLVSAVALPIEHSDLVGPALGGADRRPGPLVVFKKC